MFYSKTISAAKDGTFEFQGLPPGRYVVNAYFDQDGIIAINPEHEVEVGPGAVAQLEIQLQPPPDDHRPGRRRPDRQGGCGDEPAVPVTRTSRNLIVSEATTDAEGRYTIPARPGKTAIQPIQVPKSYLGPDYSEYPTLEIKADHTLPDVKLTLATGLDGVVVDKAGQPIVGAEVFVVVPDPPGARSHDLPTRTGPGGTFHLEQLDPDDMVSLRARADDATTDGAVVVHPDEVNGKRKLTLTIDTGHTFRIRGMVTDQTGKRIAEAKATL